MPHVVRGHHVFPLDAFCTLETLAVRVFARFEIATAEVDILLVVISATAVECLLQFAVIYATHLLARVAVVVVLWGGSRVYARLGERREECSAGKRENNGTAHGP